MSDMSVEQAIEMVRDTVETGFSTNYRERNYWKGKESYAQEIKSFIADFATREEAEQLKEVDK